MRTNRALVAGIPLGIWLLIAPFSVYEAMFAPNFWNDVLVGVTVLFLALYGVVASLRNQPVSIAAGGLLGLLGLWQTTRPFVVATAGPLPLWGDVIVGILLAALGGRTVREARSARVPERASTSQR
ncbi:SPW repeat domain-containing protein [Haladaptatus sp. NG-SE-30]